MQIISAFRKIPALLLIVCMFTVLPAGCDVKDKTRTGYETTSTSPVQKNSSASVFYSNEITLWMKKGFVDDSNTMIVQRGKEFEAKYNVKINVEIITYEDLQPKWFAALESGKTPDVSSLGYQEVGQFYEKGVLMDLTSLYNKIEKDQGAFYPSLKNAVTFEGKQYSIPFWAEAIVMYYRKDLLSAAGFKEPPQTWEEYRKVAKATTDPSKGIYGAGIGYGKGNSDSEWFTRSVIWSYGGSEVSKDGRTVSINSHETTAAMKLIYDMFLTDRSTPPSAIGWDDMGNNKAYLSGQAVTVFNSGSIANSIKTENPDLYKNTGIAPFPTGPKGRFIPGIENTLGIFKNSGNPELAQRFIEFLMDKEWYSSWIDKSAPLLCPVYSELENRPIWQQPMNKPFIQSIKDFTFLGYRGDFTSKAGEVYNLRLLNDTVQEMISNKMPPDKAVLNLQTRIEAIYKRK